MTEDAIEEYDEQRETPVPIPSVRLVIVPDLDDKDWTHFYTPRAFITTFDCLPYGLSSRLRSTITGLIQRKITRLDYDSGRHPPALADLESLTHHPFDLRLLHEDVDFEDLFSAVNWWIEREQRKFLCGRDSYHGNIQAHTTWTCECGAVINVEKEFIEMCSDSQCPSWEKYEYCTGKRYKKPALRLA